MYNEGILSRERERERVRRESKRLREREKEEREREREIPPGIHGLFNVCLPVDIT